MVPLPSRRSLPRQLLCLSLERKHGKSLTHRWHDAKAGGTKKGQWNTGELWQRNRPESLNTACLSSTDEPDWSWIPGVQAVFGSLWCVVCLVCVCMSVYVFNVRYVDVWVYLPCVNVWVCMCLLVVYDIAHRVTHRCSIGAWSWPF